MNLEEAYKTLELPNNASIEDAKKKRKELMKKYHPDVNKAPDAEAKFKKINEAFDVIQKGENVEQGQHINVDFWGGKKKKRNVIIEEIHLHANLSYKEAIFGTHRDFSYERIAKCNECNGQGVYTLHNGCDACGGRGIVISQRGGMIMQSTCPKCHGKVPTENCKSCNGTGGIKGSRSINVTIPGGVTSENILKLDGMGNFVDVVNNFFSSGDSYTDAFVHLSVQPPTFTCTIKNNNLHTPINISLLEALTGCSKSIDTLDGTKDITIPSRSKNGQQVIIPNLGVSRKGNQIIDINVEYPQNIDELVSYLKKGN